jgi:hypothetical protein
MKQPLQLPDASGTLMTLYKHVRALRGGEAPEAPAWVPAVLADALSFEREEHPDADPLLGVQRFLGRRLQQIAQAALSGGRVSQDGPYRVWEGTLPAGFVDLGELKAFAHGTAYALVTPPGAPEPDVSRDRQLCVSWFCAWGKL